MIVRCSWCESEAVYVDYHDREWGQPEHDDQKLFEKLILDGAQAGLSWITILKKRDGYRRAFDGFDPQKVSRYSEKRIEKLMQDPGIVRNRLKIASAVANARAYLKIKDEGRSFDEYLWQFVDGRTRQNAWISLRQIPATTRESDAMSRDLKERGFKFAGSTICYAFMQAVGMVNDHVVSCFRYTQLKRS